MNKIVLKDLFKCYQNAQILLIYGKIKINSKEKFYYSYRIHGNNINDDMFFQLYLILHENCQKLTSLDIGDNKLTNKSIVSLCSLIVPDGPRKG